jgi:hypothetical protein
MDETEQVSKLGKVVALQRLLESRIAQGSQRLESLKGELQHAAEAAFGHFGNVLSELRDRRHAKHLDRLKEMVEPERWPYAEATAISFIRFASDLAPLDLLDNSADLLPRMLRAGAAREAAEALLADILKLETEKAAER